MPIEAMTLGTHQILIEMDHQVDYTGPIKQSLGIWIERACKRVV